MQLRSAFLLQVSGAAVPALVMLLSVPLIRAQLDLDHFAAFTVMLAAVGLLAVLDGGLGRASTYFISVALARGSRRRVVSVFHGVLIVGLLFSLLLGLTCAFAVQTVSGHAIDTARPALLILAGFAPVFVASSLLRGFLEAEQRFGRSSSLQLLHGTLIGIAPVLLFSFSSDLRLFAWIVGLARVVLTLALLQSCGLATRASWCASRATSVHARRVFGYTKWLFLSNLIGLTIVFADRFFVASLFSSAVIAAYVLPMEMIGRLQVLITAFCSVLFPRLVARTTRGGASDSRRLLADAQGAVLCAAALGGAGMALAAEPLMRWWLGDALADNAARVLVVGIVGIGLIASAALAMLELNSRGLTRPVALLHAAEMPVYLGLLYLAARSSSIALLLIVWIARLAVDAIGMSLMARNGAAPAAARSRADSLRRLTPWGMVLASLLALAIVGLSSNALPLPLRALAGLGGVTAAILAGRQFVGRLRLSILSAH